MSTPSQELRDRQKMATRHLMRTVAAIVVLVVITATVVTFTEQWPLALRMAISLPFYALAGYLGAQEAEWQRKHKKELPK